jgi:hypothetical protein
MATVVDTAIPAAGGGITQLTGDVTAGPGAGSQAATNVNAPTHFTHSGDVITTAITAPGTPAAGKAVQYVDSTSKNLASKNDAGVINHGVQTKAAVGHQWLTSIADDGSSVLSQPAYSDLTGSIPDGTLAAGQIAFTGIVAPGTPSAGRGSVYEDSTSKNLAIKNDAGVVNHGIQTKAAVANQWLTSIADDGTSVLAQPAFSNISGTATQAQLPDVVIGVQRIAASGTYTATAGTKSQVVEGWGSGGGGGGTTSVATSEACGGGGAAGGYFLRKYAIVGGGTGTVAIGVAGTAGAATGATGGTGGNTTFTDGTTLCTAFGGLGGVGMTGGSLKTAAGGAAGAISTNGTVNATGAPGAPGITLAASVGVSGAGGSCLVGGGGVGSTAQGAGAAGLGNGSGGAGGTTVNGGAAVAGGAGTVGVVVITEFA